MSVECFGNPNNPFGEVDNMLLRDRVVLDPVRASVSKQILLMSAWSDRVQVEDIEGLKVRTLEFPCTAPFEPDLGIYLNEADLLIDSYLRRVIMFGASITLGDTTLDGTITRRWMTLRRRDNVEFGVSGVSHIQDGDFEKWTALTMKVDGNSTGPRASLWGEPTSSESLITEIIPDGADRRLFAHYDSVRKAISKQVERL